MAVTAPRPVPWISQTGRTLSVRKEVQSIREKSGESGLGLDNPSKVQRIRDFVKKSFWIDNFLVKWLGTSKYYIF